jgi:hypothetical protein
MIASSCGSGRTDTALSVRIKSGIGSSTKDQRFTLRCDPTGGDMPNRAVLCKMISEHPQAMLDPGKARSTCIGGIGTPSVSVSGTRNGHRVDLKARVMCEWPGGGAALAYWAAADMPHSLALATLRIHCDDDTELQKTPIDWARVRACVGALPPHWRPTSG